MVKKDLQIQYYINIIIVVENVLNFRYVKKQLKIFVVYRSYLVISYNESTLECTYRGNFHMSCV